MPARKRANKKNEEEVETITSDSKEVDNTLVKINKKNTTRRKKKETTLIEKKVIDQKEQSIGNISNETSDNSNNSDNKLENKVSPVSNSPKGNKELKTEVSLPQKNTKTRRVINMQTIEDSLTKIELELIKERNNINGLLKMFSDVRKDYGRLSKEISKKGKKKTDYNEKKKLTGALGPIFLDDELCDFLNKPKGTQMNAPEVIKSLNVYIVNNKLQLNDNKTIINPDDKLSNLLQVDEGDQLTYFNIQKYLSKHYIKNKT